MYKSCCSTQASKYLDNLSVDQCNKSSNASAMEFKAKVWNYRLHNDISNVCYFKMLCLDPNSEASLPPAQNFSTACAPVVSKPILDGKIWRPGWKWECMVETMQCNTLHTHTGSVVTAIQQMSETNILGSGQNCWLSTLCIFRWLRIWSIILMDAVVIVKYIFWNVHLYNLTAFVMGNQ